MEACYLENDNIPLQEDEVSERSSVRSRMAAVQVKHAGKKKHTHTQKTPNKQLKEKLKIHERGEKN